LVEGRGASIIASLFGLDITTYPLASAVLILSVMSLIAIYGDLEDYALVASLLLLLGVVL